MINDPIVNEVRTIRDELAKKFNYDIDAIFADLRERQKKYSNRIVSLVKRPKTGEAVTPVQSFDVAKNFNILSHK